MSILCPPLAPGSAVVPSLAAYIECKAGALGTSGFSGAFGTASSNELLIASLTLFVALIGLRLLAGEHYSLQDATRAALRVGLVVVFATNWGAFETVFYKVATEAPSHLASSLLAPLGVPSASVEETANGFQAVYDAVNHGAGAKPNPPAATPVAPPGASASPAAMAVPASEVGPASNLTPEGPAGILLMTSSLAGLLAMRLATGFLLALGPLVIIFTLFDSMLGVFEGWISGLIGATLAALSASIGAALELDFLRDVVVPRATTLATPFTDPGLLITCAVFAVVTLAGFAASFTLARGFKLRFRLQQIENRTMGFLAAALPPPRTSSVRQPAEQPARTRLIVDAIRRSGGAAAGTTLGPGRGMPSEFVDRDPTKPAREVSWIAPSGLGQRPRRGTRTGKTVSVARRDNRR